MFNKKKKVQQPEVETVETVETASPIDNNDDFEDFFDAEPEEMQQVGFSGQTVSNTEEVTVVTAVTNEAEELNQVEQVDMILYIVIDKPIFGLINYFRETGVKVSNIFSSITEAKNAVLMQSEPTRIVVIDTGLGKFTTTTMRAELIDMLGISDEGNKTTVFYTDSALKIDTNRTLGKLGKSIDWIQYNSTAIVAATILEYKEQYKYDMEDADEKLDNEDEILNFKGLTGSSIVNTQRMNISGFSSDSILIHVVNGEGEQLQGYKVNL